MADLVVGVVGDVLRHVAVKHTQPGLVARVGRLLASELGVLLPEIRLEELGRGEESENGNVAPAASTPLLRNMRRLARYVVSGFPAAFIRCSPLDEFRIRRLACAPTKAPGTRSKFGTARRIGPSLRVSC